jgi:hypothetical protein
MRTREGEPGVDGGAGEMERHGCVGLDQFGRGEFQLCSRICTSSGSGVLERECADREEPGREPFNELILRLRASSGERERRE